MSRAAHQEHTELIEKRAALASGRDSQEEN